MKVIIRKVTGNTENKGVYQNKEYTVTSRHSDKVDVNGRISDHSSWYDIIDSKGNKFILWNVNNDWSVIGLRKYGKSLMNYTKEFEVIDLNII